MIIRASVWGCGPVAMRPADHSTPFSHFSPLWTAIGPFVRQWRSLGERLPATGADQTHRLANPPGYPVTHGRPTHPQTQGKDERFHRTLKAEVLQGCSFADLEDCQRHFDPFRERYNLVRPHEALGWIPPANTTNLRAYAFSQRCFPRLSTIPARLFVKSKKRRYDLFQEP